jgi:hypothetical protein
MHNKFLVLPNPKKAINYNHILDIHHDEENQKIIITLDEKFSNRVITIAGESNPESYRYLETWFLVARRLSN